MDIVMSGNSGATSFIAAVPFNNVSTSSLLAGSVAVTVVWKWMYNNRYGVFNYLLKSTGIIDQNINWLGDARFALWCIILILFTTSVGQPIVLYVSALGNVDHTLVEAAQVDGANRRQVFWKIKWSIST